MCAKPIIPINPITPIVALSVFRFQLTLLRRLFFLAARHSEQAPSALAPQRQFSVFRSPLSVPLPFRCEKMAVR